MKPNKPYILATEKYPSLNEDKLVLKDGIRVLDAEGDCVMTVSGKNLHEWTADMTRELAEEVKAALNSHQELLEWAGQLFDMSQNSRLLTADAKARLGELLASLNYETTSQRTSRELDEKLAVLKAEGK